MGDYTYILSLVIVVALIVTFYRNNSHILMLVVVAVGVYLVYSHETGYTSKDFKNQIVKSIDNTVKDYDKSHKNSPLKDENSK